VNMTVCKDNEAVVLRRWVICEAQDHGGRYQSHSPRRVARTVFNRLVWVFEPDQICEPKAGGGVPGECSVSLHRRSCYVLLGRLGISRPSNIHTRFVVDPLSIAWLLNVDTAVVVFFYGAMSVLEGKPQEAMDRLKRVSIRCSTRSPSY
jgi:hypothetical protein